MLSTLGDENCLTLHFAICVFDLNDFFALWGRTGAVVTVSDNGSRGPRVAVRCDLEQVTFIPCLVLVKPRKPWTYNWLGKTVT